MPKISIILPVYNVERYLEECLNSIKSQSLTDWECICVNDGSTDHSAEILANYARTDDRIKMFTQENKGLAATRMVGLSKAVGEYIFFVDSDDFIDVDACSRLLNLMETTQADVLGFSYKTFPNGDKSSFSMRTNEVLTPLQLLQSTKRPQASDDLCFVWRYVARRGFLQRHQIEFNPEVRFAEDMIFVMELFAHAKTIYLTDETLYNYRTDNQNSIMHDKRYNPYMESSLSIVYDTKKKIIIENHWDDFTPFSFDLAERAVKNYSRMLMNNRKSNGEPKEQYIREVLQLPMMQDAMNVIGYRNIYDSWKEYMVYLCMKFNLIMVLKRYF